MLPVDPTNHGNNYVRSVTRAVAIMKFLSAHGGSSLTEVAKGVNIYKSTAHRLLTTLKDEGLIEQDAATAKYRLGFGLAVLASSVTADLDILRCARPVCERLSEQTQETVTISVLEGDDVVSIHQAISRSSAMNGSEPSASRSAASRRSPGPAIQRPCRASSAWPGIS